MINANTIGSHLSKASAADLSPLVEKIAKRADTNHDGKVSSGEFQEFLAGLVKSIDEDQADAPATTAAAVTHPLVAGTPTAPAATAITTIRAVVAAIAKEQ